MKGFTLLISCFICHVCMSAAFEDKSIEEWLVEGKYATFAFAVNYTGLTLEMEASGPYTVFLPSDLSFLKLGYAEVQTLLTDKKQANYLLKYHIIPKFVLTASVTSPMNIVNGETILIEPTPSGLLINNRSHVIPGSTDIILNNGIIHLIDNVLEPPNLPKITTTGVLLTHDNEFRDIFMALLLTNFTHMLDNGDYTLFAPIDSAFAQFQDTLLHPSAPNSGQIYDECIRYHIVPGTHKSAELKDGQTLMTLQGTALNITVNSSGVFINNAKVIDPDLSGENGVVHGIDHLLIPDSLKAYAYGNQG